MKSKLFKKLIAVGAAAAMTAQLGFVIPVSAAVEKDITFEENFNGEFTPAANTAVVNDPTNESNKVLQVNNGASYTPEALPADGGTYSFTADVYYPMNLTGSGDKGYNGGYLQFTTGSDAGMAVKMHDAATIAYVAGGGSGTFGDLGAAALNTWYTIRINMNLIGTAQKSADFYLYNKADYDTNGSNATPLLTRTGMGFRNAKDMVNKLIIGLDGSAGEYYYIDNLQTFTEHDPDAKEAPAYVEISGAPSGAVNITEDTEYAVSLKVVGTYGGDLTDEASVTWDVKGLDNDDGYVIFNGMTENSKSFTWKIREGVSNYFGVITANVTCGETSFVEKIPFAIIGSTSSDSNQLYPMAGYPVYTDSYADSMVGYQIKATSDAYRDLVLSGWTIYGSNGARTLTLSEDEYGKYFEFSKGGGTSGSTVGAYNLGSVNDQFIMETKMKFTAPTTLGYYDKTPNNTTTAVFSLSYAGNAITSGTGNISGIEENKWYKVLVSCDMSIKSYSVYVYDENGDLVDKITDQVTGETAPKWIAVNGDFPVNLKDMRIYKPVLDTISINSSDDIVRVPETGTNTVDLSAVMSTSDGLAVTGNVNWSLADDYANIELQQTGAQTAVLKVNEGAAAGDITVIASKDGKNTQKVIKVTTSADNVAFTKSTSSITIPFDGEDAVVAEFAAETRNGNGEPIDGGAITYELLAKDAATVTNVKGVTFENGKMTVASGATPAVVYVRATNENGISGRVKVNIHGLNFAFGSNEPEDGYTQVTGESEFTSILGFGFTDKSLLTTNEDSVTGSDAYTFKAAVPNGNYTVSVDTTSESMRSEAVEGTTAIGTYKSGSQFQVAVCDGVLDLTFNADSSIKNLNISQNAKKLPSAKPAIFAIGDSTTKTDDDNNSWGEVAYKYLNKDIFSNFSNNGKAGDDSVVYYNAARVENVLLAINPGDYVTVNMGINSKEWATESVAYPILLENYYVQGILQRGGIPVIVTATPQGPVSKGSGNYNSDTGFTCNRGDDARNGTLREIARKYNLNIIELGLWGDDYFNSLTEDDVANPDMWGPYTWNSTGTDLIAYPSMEKYEEHYKAPTNVRELVSSWYNDHNHYTSPLGDEIAKYILGELEKIATSEQPEPLDVTYGQASMADGAVTIPVTTSGEGTASANVFVAQYDKDGVLIDSVVEAQTVTQSTTELAVKVTENENAASIILYIWDKDMTPQTNAQTLKKQQLYGIVDRVWNNQNTEDDQIELITDSGKVLTYIPATDEVYNEAKSICYTTGTPNDASNKFSMADRVVKYEVNDIGYITSITKEEDTVMVNEGIYIASTSRIGPHRLSKDASVVDISEAYDPNKTSSYSSSDVSLSDISMLEDNESYTAIIANKTIENNVYRFVLVLRSHTIGIKSPVAVVNSTGIGIYNEETLNYVEVASNTGEITKFYLSANMRNQNSDDVINNLKKGDAIVYTLNKDGIIDTLTVLFSGIDASEPSAYNRNLFENYAISKADNKNDKNETWYQTFYGNNNKNMIVPDKWSSSLIEGPSSYVRIAFGPVVDKTINSITLAKVIYDSEAEEKYKYYTTNSQTYEMFYTNNVNFYVCDFNNDIDNRLFRGTAGTVIKTHIPSIAKDQDGTIYWNSAYEYGYYIEDINYAFVKMVDGDVTDVYFINGLYE